MDEVEEWVKQEEETKREGRIERLRWLIDNTPSTQRGFLFYGGEMAARLYEEARYCFVEAQYLATAILCVSFVEHHLSGTMYGAGDDDAEDFTAYDAIREGKKRGLISEDEASALHDARKVRNPIAHFQAPSDEDRLSKRAREEGVSTHRIAEEDARNALNVMFQVIARQGIGISPEDHPDQSQIDEFL